jgi:hypothetical protein
MDPGRLKAEAQRDQLPFIDDATLDAMDDGNLAEEADRHGRRRYRCIDAVLLNARNSLLVETYGGRDRKGDDKFSRALSVDEAARIVSSAAPMISHNWKLLPEVRATKALWLGTYGWYNSEGYHRPQTVGGTLADITTKLEEYEAEDGGTIYRLFTVNLSAAYQLTRAHAEWADPKIDLPDHASRAAWFVAMHKLG